MIKFRTTKRNFYKSLNDLLIKTNQSKNIMAFAQQLDLFESNDPVDLLRKDFTTLNKKCQNVQKGLFARFGTVQEEIDLLRDLCYKMRMEIDDLKGKKAEMIEFPNIKG